jgi:hypothetical protein
MRRLTLTKKRSAADRSLDRILAALEAELVAASDDEIVEVARDLGMNLAMKGSAAFIGLKYPSRADVRAYFEPLFDSDSPLIIHEPPAGRADDDEHGAGS